MRADNKVGARIKAPRLKRDLSQRNRRTRPSYAYISRIEAAARTPSLSVIELADRLETSALAESHLAGIRDRGRAGGQAPLRVPDPARRAGALHALLLRLRAERWAPQQPRLLRQAGQPGRQLVLDPMAPT